MDSGSLFDKIIAVIIALILWVYVVNVINPPSSTTIIGVPVQLLNQEVLAASNLAIAGTDQYTVDVVIEGARSDILAVKKDDITANADLFGFGKGQNYLTVTVIIPEKVVVKEIRSSRIPVLIDELVRVSKPVQLQVSYTNKNYEIGAVTMVPATMDVVGAKSLVDAVPYVLVKLTEEQLKEESMTFECSAETVNSDGNSIKGVRLSSAYVSVTASLYSTKVVPLEVPLEGVLAQNIELISQDIPQSITIKGPAEILKNIQAIRAQPIPIENLIEDATFPIVPILPEGIEVADKSLNLTATFKLSEVAEISFEYGSENIWIYNIPEGYTVSALPGKITVIARGDEAIISVLQSSDLQPAINAAALTEGKNEVTLSTRYMQQLVRVKILPDIIKVNMEASGTNEVSGE